MLFVFVRTGTGTILSVGVKAGSIWVSSAFVLTGRRAAAKEVPGERGARFGSQKFVKWTKAPPGTYSAISKAITYNGQNLPWTMSEK